uniref:glycosyltransferase WbsX family protein n=1 Tax=Stella sp. TaxID=2912054 RepID=UPI0035AE7A80
GFYDLRLPEVMEQQATLAQAHGIHAFCHYYYWFDGRRLLETPLAAMLGSGRPDMPFCLCWANESWTRAWDGAETDVIVPQSYSPGCFERLVADLLPYLRDPRYLRIDGRPLLVLYRPGQFPDRPAAVAEMRRAAARHGIDLCLAACLAFGYADAALDGFDLAIEFPPLTLPSADIAAGVAWTEPFRGHAYDYDALVTQHLLQPEPSFPTVRTAMVGFDNTARRGADAHLFLGATPELFETWLSALVARSRRVDPAGRRLVFVNAWNEWGEGNHLEPDQRFGRRWLQACARATARSGAAGGPPGGGMTVERARAEMERLAAEAGRDGGPLQRAVAVLRAFDERLRAAEAATDYLGRYHADWLRHVGGLDPRRPVPASEIGPPARLRHGRLRGHVEHPTATATAQRRSEPLVVRGWIVDADPHPDGPPRCLVALVPAAPEATTEPLFAVADHGLERRDVGEALAAPVDDRAGRSGFAIRLDLSAVAPGSYFLRVGLGTLDGTAYLPQAIRIEIA